MSGHKYSRFELTRDRLHKLDVLRQCGRLRGRREAVAERLASLLEHATGAALDEHAAQAGRARAWLAFEPTTPDATLSPACSRQELELALAERERALEEGEPLLRALAAALGPARSEQAAALDERLDALEDRWAAGRDVVALWCAREAGSITERLTRARARMAADRLAEVARDLPALERLVAQVVERAEAHEARHQQRLYVLRSLRQVCADMGFVELGPPRQADPRDRASDVQIRLDTLDRGQIDFRLTLGEIHARAGLEAEECYEEFALLADHLADEFGVRAAFVRDEGQTPISRQQGEKDEPTDDAREQAPER